jgi:hypothetical protein
MVFGARWIFITSNPLDIFSNLMIIVTVTVNDRRHPHLSLTAWNLVLAGYSFYLQSS